MKITKSKYNKRFISLDQLTGELEIDGVSGGNIEGLRLAALETYTIQSEKFGETEKIGLVFFDEDNPDDSPLQFSAGRNTNRMHCLLLQLSNLKTFGNLCLSAWKNGERVNVGISQEGSQVKWGAEWTPAEKRTDHLTQSLVDQTKELIGQELKLNPSLGPEAGSEPKDDKIATDHRPGRDTEKSSKVKQYPLTGVDEEEEDDLPF